MTRKLNCSLRHAVSHKYWQDVVLFTIIFLLLHRRGIDRSTLIGVRPTDTRTSFVANDDGIIGLASIDHNFHLGGLPNHSNAIGGPSLLQYSYPMIWVDRFSVVLKKGCHI